MQTWQRARPYLEQMPPEGRDQQEEKSSQPPKLSAREEAIEFVDSQEPALPEGNKKHVVVQENGAQRELTAEEKEVIYHNELLEEQAAEIMREEEQQQWEDFRAASLRSWESCVASNCEFQQGRMKRARRQVLVQGEGGRVQ